MNINDVTAEEVNGFKVEVDKLEAIFSRQEELEEKYRPIEERQGVGYGLLKDRKFDLNHTNSQELLKNFAWRVVEELTEATTAHDPMHKHEETIDALHFLVGLALLAGVTPKEIIAERLLDPAHPDMLVTLLSCHTTGDAKPNPYRIVEQLGLAMNCLKQKPWKQTHILTDANKFRKHIIYAFHEFGQFCVDSGMNSDLVYDVYFKKASVNAFRQRSNY